MVEANVIDFAYTAIKALLENLSVMSVNLLTPALLFSKMTETLDPSLLVELWNEPLFYFIYGGFSLLWSRVGCRILKINKEYARLCDVATFFSNTNTLPVSLIKSIALSAGSHFLLKDADDTPLKVAARGVSYAMIFATLNNILRWSFGVALMGGMDSKNKSAFNSVSATPRTPALTRNASGIHDLPTSPALASSSSPALDMLRSYASNSTDDESDELTPFYLGAPARPISPESRRSSISQKLCSAVRGAQKIWNSIQSCITPPVYAITAAFIVIIIEPLHKAFMDQNHVLYTIWSAIDMCGDACVPLILISLGGQLGVMSAQAAQLPKQQNNHLSANTASVPSATQADRGHIPPIVIREATESGGALVEIDDNTETGSEIAEQSISAAEQRKGIVLVLVGRFVFVPTLAVILLTTLRVMFPALLPIMANDPVYMLTLLILSSTPPAINLITVSQATGKFETEAAQILFYGYVLGIFVLAIEVSGFLWLTNVLANL
ncbi:hypothetical protein GGI26_000755 [Coemansia sp. RSA 1358]|nr:hypothetical protein GGI26_000755 [Coemansia sp. RSA 1358]